MTRRASSKASKQRVCAKCGNGIAEQRPVFLVETEGSGIVGPLHAGCAELIALARKRGGGEAMVPGRLYGRVVGAQIPLPGMSGEGS